MLIQLEAATGELIHQFDALRDDAPDVVVWDQRFFVPTRWETMDGARIYREASIYFPSSTGVITP